MRPLKLELTAFGPFAGKEEVDFESLADLGLYLVAGNTGAGKTSVFDAMVYALYGKVPGARGASGEGVARLRSDFASPSVTAAVQLEFDVRGTVWRVHRTPEQYRARKRGDGPPTKVNKKATLERSTGSSWTEQASGIGAVDARIVELLGLNHEQFSQVVLLPQGKFERVLQARATEREALLRTLFATEGYERAAEYLKTLATDRRGEAKYAEARADEVLGTATTAWASALRGLGEVTDSTKVAVSAWVDDGADPVAGHEARLAHLDEWGKAVTAEQIASDDAVDDKRELLRQAEEQAARFDEAEKLRAALDEFDESKEQADVDGKRLEAARKAGPVVEALDQLAELSVALAKANTSHADVVEALVAAGLPTDEVPATAAEANRLSQKWSKTETECRGYVTDLEDAAGQSEVAKGHTEDAAAAAQKTVVLDESIKELTDELDTLEAELKVAAAARDQLPAASDAQRNADEAHAAANGLDLARRQAKKAESYHRKASKAAATAEADLDAQRERDRTATAAQLARDVLVDGDPCPVCGSLEHPNPAPPPKGRSSSNLDDVEAAYRDALGAAVDAKGDLRRAKSDLSKSEKAYSQAGLGEPEDDLRQIIATAKTSLANADAELKKVQDLAGDASGLDKKVGRVRKDLQDARDSRAEEQASVKQLEALAKAADKEFRRLTNKVERVIGKGADPSALAAEASTVTEALAAVLAVLGALAEATTLHEAQEGAVAKFLKSSGFASSDKARSAALPDDEVDEIAERLDDRNKAESVAKSRLDALAKVGISKTRPDVEVATNAIEIATGHAKAVRAASVTLSERRRVFDAAAEDASKKAGVAVKAREAADLAETVDKNIRLGSGGRSLESWVLAHHLRAVAAEASVRLLEMTAGRYAFVVSDTDDNGSVVGLRLDIDDRHTNETRSVNSLSGGETFLASLSLALGLADTVQRRSGGIQINCLFVDEGFGALDSDALDKAIDTLGDLQAGGRTVGVISHVQGVKDRFALGLQIVKTDKGSHIRARGD